jgi:hypothetical protein
MLDGREVPLITAYLFHAGGHGDPASLQANEGKSFVGSYVLGMGFTFDDTDKTGVANPVSLMHELIAKDGRNAKCIFPYIGGEEVNDDPTHSHHRYVINFSDLSEDEARYWPDLIKIVEAKVKPQRDNDKRESYRRYWWQYAEKRVELQLAKANVNRVLVCPIISNKLSFVFLPVHFVCSHKLMVFVLASRASLAVLQCRIHEAWARVFTSTMKDDLNYSNTDCFETFPFPQGVLEHAAGEPLTTDNRQLTTLTTLTTLESAGRDYYEFRAALMVRNNEGLTKTYNRFHDPEERSPDILKLRELHAAMDKAVLEAYGWNDLAEAATCKFLLDYEEDEDDDEEPSGRRRKKPWRYRWPDDFRDEVLARLLALNAERAEQERLQGESTHKTADPEKTKSPRSRRNRGADHQGELPLF